ncbi:hypothetical protein MJO28_004081 [Puccinia striiformis f. sp. tritici]|uniref:Uncharacterized protein n=1 Tax=Puccinia striiformis f. sp. tritici TaxID=168172 RepID=A0ACC0ENT1_9BASI|nr:hypothetical protein MJO28_004081 [Puccinia striiformis f. sp. tritici]
MTPSENNVAAIVVIEDDQEKEISDAASESASTDTLPNSLAESRTESNIAVDVETESEGQSKKRKLTSKVWDHFERITEGKQF